MDKTASIPIWHVLLAIIAVFVLVSCGTVASNASPLIITPTYLQSPTPVPQYIHYAPSIGSNVHLEFKYPNSWTFSQEKIRDTDIIVIGLGDPRFRTVPARSPNEPHGTPSYFGSIAIRIESVKPDQALDELVKPYKQGHSDKNWITALNDYEVKVDGYDANVLEYQIKPLFEYNGYTSSMFERDIFFVVKDQIYQIEFIVAEKDRGDEFEKGYEYFFNSLKIVP